MNNVSVEKKNSSIAISYNVTCLELASDSKYIEIQYDVIDSYGIVADSDVITKECSVGQVISDKCYVSNVKAGESYTIVFKDRSDYCKNNFGDANVPVKAENEVGKSDCNITVKTAIPSEYKYTSGSELY